MGGQLEIGPSSFKPIGPPGRGTETARGSGKISPLIFRSPVRPQPRISPLFRIPESRPLAIRTNHQSQPSFEIGVQERGVTALALRAPGQVNLDSSPGRFERVATRPALTQPAVIDGLGTQALAETAVTPMNRVARVDMAEHKVDIPGANRAETSLARPPSKVSADPQIAEWQTQRPKTRIDQSNEIAGKAGVVMTSGLQVAEGQRIQLDQQSKVGQNRAEINKLNTSVNKRETIDSEQINTSVQAQRLEDIFRLTEPLVVAVKTGILTRANAENRITAQDASVLPKITVEANQALEKAGETVRVLDRSQPGLRIVTGAEAREVLMTGETSQVRKLFESARVAVIPTPELQPALDPLEQPQLMKTYKALMPSLGHEKALNLVGQSVEQRVQLLSPAQQVVLAERIIKETDPETLLENLPADERWRVEVFVKRIVQEKQIDQKVVVWEPGMRARRRKIERAFGSLDSDQMITGAELVAKIGPQTSDEIGPINPKGQNSGGGDQFRRAVLEGDFTKKDVGLVIGISEVHPTLEVVTEEVVAVREATDQEIYDEIHGRLPEIIAFAKQRAMVMLANLAV